MFHITETPSPLQFSAPPLPNLQGFISNGVLRFETARMVRSVEDADALRRKSKYSGGVTVRRVKIVGVAMAPVHHTPDRWHATGMDGVISKPIEEGQLLATLSKIFNPPQEAVEGAK